METLKILKNFISKIHNIKSEIKDLGITMNEAITIQVFNFLDSFFAQFLGILSHEARKKDKLTILKSSAKLVKDKQLSIKNLDKTTANYAKQFTMKNDKSPVAQIQNPENSVISLSLKYKFCQLEHEPNNYQHL